MSGTNYRKSESVAGESNADGATGNGVSEGIMTTTAVIMMTKRVVIGIATDIESE